MSQLTTLLRSLGSLASLASLDSLASLGNQGALTNVQAVLNDRRCEDWLIEGLARRLDPTALPAAIPARGARAA